MKNKNIIDLFENQADLIMGLLTDIEQDISKYFVGKKVSLLDDEDDFGYGIISSIELCDDTIYFNVDFPDGDVLDNLEKDEIIFVEDEDEKI